jgi:peptide/nickel transport system substrate-binding protein
MRRLASQTTKPRGLFLVALLLLSLVLVACGGATPTNAPATTAPASATTAPVSATTTATGASTPIPVATTAAARPTTAPATRGGNLRIALDSDLGNLDPMVSGQVVDRQVMYNMYDSLVSVDTSLKITPSLAESWDISADGLTYTFNLRKGVTFHDGTEFNAEAVKFTFDRYQNGQGSVRKSDLDSVSKIEVVDPAKIKLTLKAPNAPLLATLVDRAGMILSPAAIQKGGADFTRNPLGAGSGAFKFVEWKKDDRLVLERNDKYWKKDAAGNALPYLDRVTYRPIVDDVVRSTNLKTGDIDVANVVAARDVEELSKNNDLNFKFISSTGYTGLRLNATTEPFNNKALRQAVGFALDANQLFKTAYFSVGAIAQGPIPPSSWAFDPNFKPYTRDLTKAKAKLTEGGKPNGFTFKVFATAGSPQTQQIAEIIRDQLADVNIKMEIEQLEFPKIVESTRAKTFTSALIGWSGRIDPDGNMFAHFKTGGSNNDSGYSSPEVDKLLDQARAVSNQDERKKLYQEAQKIIMEDLPYPLFYHGPAYQAINKKVQNFLLMPDGIIRLEAVSLAK